MTGANRGIGLELVRQFVGKGNNVFAACRDPEGATQLKKLVESAPEGSMHITQLDVTDPASVTVRYFSALSRFG